MKNNKSYFSIFADDFKLMKTELSSDEIIEMMSALSDLCMWGETEYQPNTAKKIYFWDKLKGKFDCDTDIYKKKSEAGKLGMYNRWHNKKDNKSDNKDDNTIYNKQDNHLTPNTITPNSIEKENVIKEKVSKFGELGFVRLTDEQYTTLKEKYPNIDDGIEVLDTYLATTGSKHRNKNHYGFFKSNSWVWERVNENKPATPSVGAFVPVGKISDSKINKIVEDREKDDEEQRKRAEEAVRRSEFIKKKGYPSMLALISAGKEVYDRVINEYKQAQGF